MCAPWASQPEISAAPNRRRPALPLRQSKGAATSLQSAQSRKRMERGRDASGSEVRLPSDARRLGSCPTLFAKWSVEAGLGGAVPEALQIDLGPPRRYLTPEAGCRAPVPVRRGTAARASGTTSRGMRYSLTVSPPAPRRMRKRGREMVPVRPRVFSLLLALPRLPFPSIAWVVRDSLSRTSRDCFSSSPADICSPGDGKCDRPCFSPPLSEF